MTNRYMKMYSAIPTHHGDANQNHNEILAHICKNGYIYIYIYIFFLKTKNKMFWVEYRERETLYTVGRNVNWCSHCETQYGGSSEKENYYIPQQTTVFHFWVFIQEKQKH